MATERIPLTQPIESRAGNFLKDSRSVNCVFETRDQKREFVKRAGLVKATQVVSITPPAFTPSQGLVGFNNNLYSVINNTLYKTVPSTYTTTTVGSTSVSTSQSYFAKTFLDSYLFLHNKTNAYTLSKAGVFGTVANDSVIGVTIVSGGSGYSEGITLSFSSGGATATPTVSSAGIITDVTVTNAGSGLTSAPTITITKPADVTGVSVDGVDGSTVATISGTSPSIYVGMVISGTFINPDTKITKIDTSVPGLTTLTLSKAATAPNPPGAYSDVCSFTDLGSNGVLTADLNSFPSGPYVSGIVFLDNYMFLGTSTDNRIYNSYLGDPTVWDGSYVSFEQTSDQLVGIARHLNYLVAFGQTSTQFFYDNANPTGSPLLLAQSYTNEIGCASGDSVVATDNTVIWVGTSKTYGRGVYLMDGTSPVRVSTSNIDRHLEADGLSKVSAYCYKYSGHTLYILTLHNSNETLVYDLNEKMWYQWTQYSMMSSDQTNPGTYQESYFRPTFYAEVLGVPYVLDDDTATIYYFDVNTYQDNGQSIYCRTVTDVVDNGSTKRKFYGRLEIIGDKVAGTLQVRHTGDDYNTWSSYRSIDLNASRSQIYLSGADRRRAWEFLCTSNVPLRLDGAEIDFRIGEMDQEQGVGGGRYRR